MKTFFYGFFSRRTEVVGEALNQIEPCSKEVILEFRELQDYDLMNPVKSPDFNTFTYDEDSILTDFIKVPSSIGFFDLIISKRVKLLLDKLNIQKTKYFEIKISNSSTGKPHIYYWMHPIEDLKSFIDYPKSKFWVCKGGAKDTYVMDINIDSLEDFIAKKEIVFRENVMLYIISSELVFLRNASINEYDFFYFDLFDRGAFHISKRFYDLIVKNKLTGFDIYHNLIADKIAYWSGGNAPIVDS